MEVFKTALLLGYDEFYGNRFVGNRLDFLIGIPKNHLIAELSGGNLRLKSPLSKEYKNSYEDQMKELNYFCGGNEQMALPYGRIMYRHREVLKKRSGGGTPIIFSRSSFLFALQEIIEFTPDEHNSEFKMQPVFWDGLLKYYLCVNNIISAYQNQEEDLAHSTFEKLAAGGAFLNELMVVNDPFLTINRFIELYSFLESDQQLAPLLNAYLNDIGLTASSFTRHVFSICFMHASKVQGMQFYHRLDKDNPESTEAFRIFDHLSRRNLVQKAHELDLIEIKKSPIYKDEDGFFFLMDTSFILDKLYELFLNDFWFEGVKGKGVNIKSFRSKIGLFFETYSVSLLKQGLTFLKYPPVKGLNELKTSITSSEIELADFYFRQNKKVAVGQIKSSGIYSEQLYGTAQSLFKETQDDFYKDFGLFQLVTSMKYLRDHPNRFENQFPVGKKVHVFPVLVVNEKVFQTPFFPAMFQMKFEEEMKKESYPNFDIKPLTLMHISDLERLTFHVGTRKFDIWETLESNYKNSLFPRPLTVTLNRKQMNPNYSGYKDRIVEFTGIEKPSDSASTM